MASKNEQSKGASRQGDESEMEDKSLWGIP